LVLRSREWIRFCRCGGPLKVVAYITDTVAIRRILDHLGLSPSKKATS